MTHWLWVSDSYGYSDLLDESANDNEHDNSLHFDSASYWSISYRRAWCCILLWLLLYIIIIIWYDTMWYHIIGMYTKIRIYIISIYFESFIFSAFCNYEADCSWNKHTQNILNRSFQSKHATCHLNGALKQNLTARVGIKAAGCVNTSLLCSKFS